MCCGFAILLVAWHVSLAAPSRPHCFLYLQLVIYDGEQSISVHCPGMKWISSLKLACHVGRTTDKPDSLTERKAYRSSVLVLKPGHGSSLSAWTSCRSRAAPPSPLVSTYSSSLTDLLFLNLGTAFWYSLLLGVFSFS